MPTENQSCLNSIPVQSCLFCLSIWSQHISVHDFQRCNRHLWIAEHLVPNNLTLMMTQALCEGSATHSTTPRRLPRTIANIAKYNIRPFPKWQLGYKQVVSFNIPDTISVSCWEETSGETHASWSCKLMQFLTIWYIILKAFFQILKVKSNQGLNQIRFSPLSCERILKDAGSVILRNIGDILLSSWRYSWPLSCLPYKSWCYH